MIKRYFRYSLDRRSWSQWYEFVPDGSPAQGMEAIETVQMNPDADLYIEYKYEYDDGTMNPLDEPIVVDSISTRLQLRDVAVSIDAESMMPSGTTGEVAPMMTFDRDATFNPYDIGGFVDIYAQTSLYTNRTFGLPVLYFRTAAKSGDYMFKEWNLFSVVERKCIKVLVPNNDFPDSKLHYNEFGIDYEVPFEAHIDKTYFEMMFGPEAEVRKKDFLYFPMLNRMYEVQGSYMFRGLMMKPLYWKVQLVKFKPNINYIMKAEDTLFLDNLLLDSEETVSQIANAEIRDATMPDQFRTISTRFDETRRALGGMLMVRQERFYFNYAQLIDYYYDLSQGIAPDSVAVTYKKSALFNSDMPNLTYTAMFNVRTAGQPFTVIQSWKEGSPDPAIGMSITGVLNGTSLDVTLRVNDTVKNYRFLNVQSSRWYALVLEMSLQYKQLGVFLYDPVDDPADSLNHNKFDLKGKYVSAMPAVTFDTQSGYVLRGGAAYIANVRVFNKILNFEEHSYVLSQLFVQDESTIYIIDNCRPQLNVPVVARPR
jgi:hypothetical protein